MVTLKEIWATPSGEVNDRLKHAGHTGTGANRDRALLAIIYYNGGQLHPADAWAVTHPNFLEAMTATSDRLSGLGLLVAPFVEKLNRLETYMAIIDRRVLQIIKDVMPMCEARELAGLLDVPRLLLTEETDRLTNFEKLLDPAWLGDTAYRFVPLGGGHRTINRLVEETWTAVLAADQAYQKSVPLECKSHPTIHPHIVIDIFLQADMAYVHPLIRCFYYYTIWELNEMFPRLTITDKLLKLLGTCGDLVAPTVSLSPLEGLVARDMLPLIKAYTDPPPRGVFIQRLLEQLRKGIVVEDLVYMSVRSSRLTGREGSYIPQEGDDLRAPFIWFIENKEGRWTGYYSTEKNIGYLKLHVLMNMRQARLFDAYGRERQYKELVLRDLYLY